MDLWVRKEKQARKWEEESERGNEMWRYMLGKGEGDDKKREKERKC